MPDPGEEQKLANERTKHTGEPRRRASEESFEQLPGDADVERERPSKHDVERER